MVAHWDSLLYIAGTGEARVNAHFQGRRSAGPRGGAVTQRSAKPCTPVQFRAWPPQSTIWPKRRGATTSFAAVDQIRPHIEGEAARELLVVARCLFFSTAVCKPAAGSCS